MKKEVKRYTVLASLTEDNIKSTGFNRWFGKYMWLSCIWLAIGVVAMFMDIKLDNAATKIMVCVIFIGWFIWFFRNYYKSGKEFFNKVKDLPEPIDLRDIK